MVVSFGELLAVGSEMNEVRGLLDWVRFGSGVSTMRERERKEETGSSFSIPTLLFARLSEIKTFFETSSMNI